MDNHEPQCYVCGTRIALFQEIYYNGASRLICEPHYAMLEQGWTVKQVIRKAPGMAHWQRTSKTRQ